MSNVKPEFFILFKLTFEAVSLSKLLLNGTEVGLGLLRLLPLLKASKAVMISSFDEESSVCFTSPENWTGFFYFYCKKL